MTTNWKNKKLREEGKLPPLPKKAPSPAPPPRKDYPLFTHADHAHPYALAARRIHELEAANKEKDAVIAQCKARTYLSVVERRTELVRECPDREKPSCQVQWIKYRQDSLSKYLRVLQ